MADNYNVAWSKTAIRSLSKLYNIDPQKVFLQSKNILSKDPHKKAYDVVNFPGFDFNGYYWVLLKNVVIIYKVLDNKKSVLIDAVYFDSAQLFWGIEPDEEV